MPELFLFLSNDYLLQAKKNVLGKEPEQDSSLPGDRYHQKESYPVLLALLLPPGLLQSICLLAQPHQTSREYPYPAW